MNYENPNDGSQESGSPQLHGNTSAGRRNSSAPVPFGLSLLMVTFLILCLFTFAAITIVSAKNSLETARSNASGKTAYYEACSTAEEKLAEFNKAASLDGAEPKKNISYSVDIDDENRLDVSAVLEDDPSPHYSVTEWIVKSKENWAPETTLPVLGAEIR